MTESQATHFADYQTRIVLSREAIHQACNDADEPCWFDTPHSVVAAYKDAAMAERY